MSNETKDPVTVHIDFGEVYQEIQVFSGDNIDRKQPPKAIYYDCTALQVMQQLLSGAGSDFFPDGWTLKIVPKPRAIEEPWDYCTISS